LQYALRVRRLLCFPIERYGSVSAFSSPILRDLCFDIAEFFAGKQANCFQRCQMIFGFGEIAHEKIRLANVFVFTLMARVECERFAVVLESELEFSPRLR